MKRSRWPVCLLLVMSGCSTAQQRNITDDIQFFRDSAHHWYDIKDEDKIIAALPDQKRYESSEIEKIADNVLLFQKANGGWPKNYDMRAILTDEQRSAVERSRNEANTTFDNGATYSHVEYLAKAFAATNDERYKAACVRGLDFILSAQYGNGGWPQFYPDTSGYRKHITFNDGAMIGVMKVLQLIVDESHDFAFLDAERQRKVRAAFDKGVDCIVRCQIVDAGRRTAWCQQHDRVDFRPQSARTFELASICNQESAEIVLFLMSLKNPTRDVVQAVSDAVQWFQDSKIFGIRVKTIEAEPTDFIYHKSRTDKLVVSDPEAPPIWARFYELETHVPLFCNRDGKPVYSMSEVERERRTGYAWYTYDPQEVLKKYPAWLEQATHNDQ